MPPIEIKGPSDATFAPPPPPPLDPVASVVLLRALFDAQEGIVEVVYGDPDRKNATRTVTIPVTPDILAGVLVVVQAAIELDQGWAPGSSVVVPPAVVTPPAA